MSPYVALLAALGAALLLALLLRPLLHLLTPKGIKGFPALPNPKPIVGDLYTLIDGMRRHGGICSFIDELASQLGPTFQLRTFNTK